MLTLRRGEPDVEAVAAVLDRFAAINGARAVGIVLTLAATICALMAVR